MIKAVPSLDESKTAFLTFSIDSDAAVKLVVASPEPGGGPGAPLIDSPFRLEAGKPRHVNVTPGLLTLFDAKSKEAQEGLLRIHISTDTESSSGRYFVRLEGGMFTKFSAA